MKKYFLFLLAVSSIFGGVVVSVVHNKAQAKNKCILEAEEIRLFEAKGRFAIVLSKRRITGLKLKRIGTGGYRRFHNEKGTK